MSREMEEPIRQIIYAINISYFISYLESESLFSLSSKANVLALVLGLLWIQIYVLARKLQALLWHHAEWDSQLKVGVLTGCRSCQWISGKWLPWQVFFFWASGQISCGNNWNQSLGIPLSNTDLFHLSMVTHCMYNGSVHLLKENIATMYSQEWERVAISLSYDIPSSTSPLVFAPFVWASWR